MRQVKYVICLDINEQVNPGSKIWLPNVQSILKPYCEPCSRQPKLSQDGPSNAEAIQDGSLPSGITVWLLKIEPNAWAGGKGSCAVCVDLQAVGTLEIFGELYIA